MNYEEIAKIIFDAGADEPAKPGLAGGENDDGNYAIQVPGDENRIFVRMVDGDREVPTEAINYGVPIKPDYPVLVYYVRKQAYAIPDPERSLAYRDGNEALSTVAPHSHEPGQGNFDVVSTIRMKEGQLSLSEPYSMVIDVDALKYWDLAGGEHWWTGDSIDLTDYVPVTTETHLVVKVTLDRLEGILALFAGEEKPISVPLTEEDIANIVTSTRYKPLHGVMLHEGMTVIDDMKYIMDWRFWIADFAEAASGVTGTGSDGVEVLSDLGDVSSASQTANFILAAGDGTIGGDYRGRLLVQADIPALDASSVTTGIFDTARIPDLDASKITTGALDMERGGLGVDASNLDGYLVTDGVSTSSIKYHYDTSPPTITDDANAGYTIGSHWWDTAADEEFVCVDATVGAAIWKSTTDTGASTSTFHGVRENLDLTLTTAFETTIGFFTNDYDTDTYSDGIDSFIIPASYGGFYTLTANVYVSNLSGGVPAAGEIFILIKKNGSVVDQLLFWHDYNQGLDQAVSLTTQTTGDVGDTFVVTIINNVGDDFAVSGHFMLHFLGDV